MDVDKKEVLLSTSVADEHSQEHTEMVQKNPVASSMILIPLRSMDLSDDDTEDVEVNDEMNIQSKDPVDGINIVEVLSEGVSDVFKCISSTTPAVQTPVVIEDESKNSVVGRFDDIEIAGSGLCREPVDDMDAETVENKFVSVNEGTLDNDIAMQEADDIKVDNIVTSDIAKQDKAGFVGVEVLFDNDAVMHEAKNVNDILEVESTSCLESLADEIADVPMVDLYTDKKELDSSMKDTEKSKVLVDQDMSGSKDLVDCTNAVIDAADTTAKNDMDETVDNESRDPCTTDEVVRMSIVSVEAKEVHDVSVVSVDESRDEDTTDNDMPEIIGDFPSADESEDAFTAKEVPDVAVVAVDESRDDDTTDDDIPEIIGDFPSARTRSGLGSLNSSTCSVNSLDLSVSSLDLNLSQDSRSLSAQKCENCRQRLNIVQPYVPKPGKAENDVIKDPLVNIEVDEEDQRPLQYKLTDFAVYDKVGALGGHLVPIFAESLISTGKKIYFSGKVLRLDSQEGDDGLQVVDMGPITEWTNMTGMDGGQENIILGTSLGGQEVEYNLLRPCEEYLKLFETTYRMVYMANRIIIKLIDYNENGQFMEYAELLEFIDSLEPPVLYGKTLPRCDEEFLQLHSDFIVSQVSSFEDAGDVEEDLTILGMPCIKHISDMAGVERGAVRRGPARKEGGMVGSTPQPETLVKAVTTPLVAELFELTFQKQMTSNSSARTKVCTCKACQSNNCGRCERCKEMVSFGGAQPDSHVVCLERQCLRRNDQEVVLGDEEVVQTKKDKVKKTSVKWLGKGKAGGTGQVFYKEVMLKLPSGVEHKVKAGDYMLVAPDSAEHKSVPHYPCRVLYLHSQEMQGVIYDVAHVQWLCRSENTVLGRTGDPREWFLIDECEDVVLSEVTKPIDIQQVKIDDIKKWKKAGGTYEAIMKDDEGGKDGWWRMTYLPEFGRFVYPREEELTLSESSCFFCKKREDQIKGEEIVVSENGNSIRIKNGWYNVGQFIMLEDETLRFKIPKKEPKVYPKASKVDSKMYPEHYRKPDEFKGDHFDTWDPFQVVRLEQIVQEKSDTFLRVRKLYRPHDTHLTHEEARTKPYTCLYWTGEIARMHLPEFASRTNKVSMESIVGRAWVTTSYKSGDLDDLINWTDDGEDRFLITEAYNSDTKKFSQLPQEVVTELRSTLAAFPAPCIDPITPLACLDIFAGCGGLSKGLHESGVTEHRWAIEFWPPSANAFNKNNSDCVVLNEECNGLLSKAMKGEKGTRMPVKGQVEMMVGGPPCQGFSLLNIYKEREYSKFKNSLIPTYLSFCDFYRPRYFILENVRNLVANENGMVLKLIIATLVKMGYQVAFNILQAGHYGVAQTRRRLIVIGAAPCEVLPVYPEPVHCFQGPHFQDIEVDGRRFSTTSVRPGAPRRALTSWDAISDLPPIESGHNKSSIPYSYSVNGKPCDGQPQSHLQKMFRSQNTSSQLEDHICKDVNALCLERIRHIPRTPGSDWRDLPNTVIKLDDGRVTRKLHYPYKKADGSRGVCSCSLSTKKRMHFCDADDKQSETMIAWSMPHTADRHNNWQGVYGRVDWDGIFKTTITDPEPLGKQGQVLHPVQDRLLSVREYARSQGFKDNFKFDGTIRDRHREIGNAVPPPLGKALGLEIRKAILKKVT